jgi:hypothetical protein
MFVISRSSRLPVAKTIVAAGGSRHDDQTELQTGCSIIAENPRLLLFVACNQMKHDSLVKDAAPAVTFVLSRRPEGEPGRGGFVLDSCLEDVLIATMN